jgi:hypothetical protein
MKLRMLRKFAFLSALIASWILLSPMPAAAFMPCCADLNCEDNYAGCVYDCSYFHGGDQSCMASCLSDADYCRTRLCSACNDHYPCWFEWTEQCGAPQWTTTNCSSNAGCAYPNVCHSAQCVQGGCGPDQPCSPGDHCANGLCVQN